MPPGSFRAGSENMDYPIRSLDWQDLVECVRQSSRKLSGHVLCLEPRSASGKPWHSKWQNFPWVLRCFSTNSRSMPRTKFHLGHLLSASKDQVLTANMWFDVNEVFKALHLPFQELITAWFSSLLPTAPPAPGPQILLSCFDPFRVCECREWTTYVLNSVFHHKSFRGTLFLCS